MLLASGEFSKPGVFLLLQGDLGDGLFNGQTLREKTAKQANNLSHRQFVRQIGFLKRDADPFANGPVRLSPASPENLHIPRSGGRQSLENFHRRGFTRPVGTQQSKALSHRYLEINPPDRLDRGFSRIRFGELAAADGDWGGVHDGTSWRRQAAIANRIQPAIEIIPPRGTMLIPTHRRFPRV